MRTTPSTPFLALAALASFTSVLAVGGLARADEPAPSTQSAPSSPIAVVGAPTPLAVDVPRVRTIEWYGWQTLSADGVSLALLVGGLAPALGAIGGGGGSSNDTLVFTGVGAYVLAAPLIHLAHDHGKRALIDLGMRVGGVALGATTGVLLGMAAGGTDCGHEACFTAPEAVGLMAGTLLGALAASAVDASVFARTKAPAEAKPAPKFSWAPSLAPVRGGASAGISGTF